MFDLPSSSADLQLYLYKLYIVKRATLHTYVGKHRTLDKAACLMLAAVRAVLRECVDDVTRDMPLCGANAFSSWCARGLNVKHHF